MTADLILAVNSGSSSLKVGLFTSDPEPVEIGSIVADGIGSDNGRVRSDGQLRSGSTTEVELQTHDAAITLVLAR
ncbi:MAG TPA: hypothetical protein VHR64_12865, partial [Thermomicrobiales bacterium]|nr:hypothetical protein [Thermomicrobiales bacterium]